MNQLAKQSEENELRKSVSEEDNKSNEEVSEVIEVPGTWATFIGTNRTLLQKEPIVYNQGLSAFGQTFGFRIKSIFTKRFLICLVAGQLLSVAITSTSVLTTELMNNNWSSE